jgi:ferredoxin, 2Fe-2S
LNALPAPPDPASARTVVVEPGSITFDVKPGESVIQAAWRAGYRWPTTCWGQADCGTCAMEIIDGGERLSDPEPIEQARLKTLPRRAGPPRRLACQTRLAHPGTLTVRKPGVKLQ